MSHYLGNNTSICKTILGQKIFVDTRDISLAPHLLMSGKWEMWITEAMRPYFQNSIFLDVGANVGWYSLAAQHYGAKRIISFEPNPCLFRLIYRTSKVNGYNWKILPIALSDNKETSHLNFDYDLLGSASLCPGVGNTEVEVQSDTLDNLWESKDIKSYIGEIPKKQRQNSKVVMKFDIEGYEAKAVLGAEKVLRETKATIFVEKHSDPKNVLRVKDMLDLMHSLNYQVGHIQTNGTIKPISRADISNVADVDMLSFKQFAS